MVLHQSLVATLDILACFAVLVPKVKVTVGGFQQNFWLAHATKQARIDYSMCPRFIYWSLRK